MSKMNPGVKTEWLARLRDPETKQCSEVLTKRDEYGVNSFCCLGVLTNIFAEQVGIEFAGLTTVLRNETTEEVLCESVRDWSGVEEPLPVVHVHRDLLESYGFVNLVDDTYINKSLADLNDNGVPFTAIADLIEAQL